MIKQPDNFDMRSILYPYILSLSLTKAQQQWFEQFFETIVYPAVKKNIDQKLAHHHHNLSNSNKIVLIQHYLDREPEKLKIWLESCHFLVRAFENEYFNNVFNGKAGFSIQDFYAQNHVYILNNIFEKSVMIYLNQLIGEVMESPQDRAGIMAVKDWLHNEYHARYLKKYSAYHEVSRISSKPNLIWYFVSGANRLPLFFQIELVQLQDMISMIKANIAQISKNPTDLKHYAMTVPICAIWFFAWVLYFALTPYRFLRSVVHEISGDIIDKLKRRLNDFGNHPDQHAYKTIALMIMQHFIEVALLTLLSLPLLPIPLTWLPGVLLSPQIMLLPLAYWVCIPIMAFQQNVYTEVFTETKPLLFNFLNKKEQPKMLIQLDPNIDALELQAKKGLGLS